MDVWKDGVGMARKMTLVFHDEDLYTQLKIEAVKRRSTASAIVSEAVLEWMESREDAKLIPLIKDARSEWELKGGRPWTDVEKEIEASIGHRKKAAKSNRV
jgi:hypothetical protein